MKEKLSNKLGILGYVLFFGLSVVFTFAPLLVLQLPFWADFLIIASVMLLPIIGTIVNLSIWGWAAYIAWNEPLSWNVVFWVVLALDILFFLFPLFLLLLEKLGVLAGKIKSPKGAATTDTYETYLVCPSCGSLVHKGEVCSSCGYQFAQENRRFWRRKSILAIFVSFILVIGIFTGSYCGYSNGCKDGFENGKSAAYEEYYNLGFDNGKQIADRDLEVMQNKYDDLQSDIYSYLKNPSQKMPLRLRLLMMLEKPEKEPYKERSQYYGGEKYEPSSESSPNQKRGSSEYLKQKVKESMDRIDKEYGSQYYGGSEYKPDS